MLKELLLKGAQQTMRSGDLFYDCHTCGRIPVKLSPGAKKYDSPWQQKWWYFTCPACHEKRFSVLWRL